MSTDMEWLSEEEMPDTNVDGTEMCAGVDANSRPYGRTEAWENDPWNTPTVYPYGPSPFAERKPACPRRRRTSWSWRRRAPVGRRHDDAVRRPWRRRGIRHVSAISVVIGGLALRVDLLAGLRCGCHWLPTCRCSRRSRSATRTPRRAGLAPARKFAGRCRHRQLVLKGFAERDQIGLQCAAPVAQLDDIQATGSALDIADERLAGAELFGEIGLPQPLLGPQVAQQGADAVVFITVDGFEHGRRSKERPCKLYCKFGYRKIRLRHQASGVGVTCAGVFPSRNIGCTNRGSRFRRRRGCCAQTTGLVDGIGPKQPMPRGTPRGISGAAVVLRGCLRFDRSVIRSGDVSNNRRKHT